MERIDMAWEPVRVILVQVGEFFPRVLLAIVILIVGWLIAKALRFATVKALRAINFNVLAEKAGIDGFIEQGGSELDTTQILGLLVYWLAILAAVALALALAFGLGGQKRAAEWLERWSRQHESELDTKKRHSLDRSVK